MTPADRAVLVVGSDPDLRAYVAHGLSHLALVIEAADGLDALAALAAQPVALVVTDLAMTRMDGGALCRAIQSDPSLAPIPVLVISGEADVEVPGACGVVPTPFNGRALRDCVAPLLRASAAAHPSPHDRPTSR